MGEDTKENTGKVNLDERSTVELTTPSGHKVVVYDYITGGEMRQFQMLFLNEVSAEEVVKDQIDDGKIGAGTLGNIKASTMLEAQDLLVELLVVSVDGRTKDPAVLVMKLLQVDTDFVIAKLDEYTSGESKKK